MKNILEENSNLAAVICIGPDLIKMRVCGLKKGKINNVDVLESPINLGHEIFNNKKISFECIKNISNILNGYLTVLKEYDINNYKVIASTFFLEAENSEYVIDQLKIHNDIVLEVLEDSQEKSLVYYNVLNTLLKNKNDKKYVLIAYISSSSVGVALYDGKDIVFSQNVRIGSLKLYDLLCSIKDETNDFHIVLEEYLKRIIGRINIPIDKSNIDTLILVGSQISLLKRFCKKDSSKESEIEKDKFYSFYEEIKDLSSKTISEKYDILLNDAELLFVSFSIYRKIFDFVYDAKILVFNADISDTVLLNSMIFKSKINYSNHIKSSSIACSKTVSEHYYCDKAHRDETLSFSELIFDKMKKIHGLDDKKRLLLENAIILHEIGYYVSPKNPRKSTFDIIKNLDVYGLKKEEVNIIAIIAKYDELSVPNVYDKEYEKLSKKNKLLVSKLIAIFRIANALANAKKQKINSLNIKIFNDEIIFTGETDENVYLEKWAFNKCAPFFEEVFGIKPQLIIKTLLF